MTVLEFPNKFENRSPRDDHSDFPTTIKASGMPRGYISDLKLPPLRYYKKIGKRVIYLNCHFESHYEETGQLWARGTYRDGFAVGFWQYFDKEGRVLWKGFRDDHGELQLMESYELVGEERRLYNRRRTKRRNGRTSERAQQFDLRGCLVDDHEYFNYLSPNQFRVDYLRTKCRDPWPYFQVNDKIPEGLPTYEYHGDASAWSPEEKVTWMRRRQAGCHQKWFVNGVLRSKRTWVNARIVGKEEEYDERGRLESRRYYDLEGKSVRRWETYERGILTMSQSWGKSSGFDYSKLLEFYKNGQLERTVYESDRERATKYYDEAGNFAHGEYVYIDKNGKWHTSPIESKNGQVFS